jgi:hypothetical protein
VPEYHLMDTDNLGLGPEGLGHPHRTDGYCP